MSAASSGLQVVTGAPPFPGSQHNAVAPLRKPGGEARRRAADPRPRRGGGPMDLRQFWATWRRDILRGAVIFTVVLVAGSATCRFYPPPPEGMRTLLNRGFNLADGGPAPPPAPHPPAPTRPPPARRG